MGTSAEKLVAQMSTGTGYDISASDARETQIAAMNERFQEAAGRIKLVGHRADDAGIREIRSLEDVVPLLLPHTAYKSYPEAFLTDQRWDRLARWLGTVSAHPTSNADLEGIADIDQWIERLGQAGHFVSCSSGTTGKSAMLNATQADLDFTCKDGIAAVEWGSDIRRGDNRVVAGSGGAVAYTPRNAAMGMALMQAFVDLSKLPGPSDVPPVTIGSITRMITLRKAIADGTAMPAEIAAFDAESEKRQQALATAGQRALDDVIAKRGEKLYLTGMWASLHAMAVAVRERGYSARDFNPENGVFLGGGLKRAQLPPDYREFVYETFNLQPRFIYQMYGMQELNTSMPRCQEGGRYHVPAWLVALPLNKDGDALAEGIDKGPVEARAAFFDLSMDGRWGGIISGDRIEIDFSPCKCGAKSPSIGDNIARYADLEGDDKIGCAGTVDAYVRGMT
jgi:hypothetical protein